MSWDVFVQKFSRPYAAIEEVPPGERCVRLGSAAEVRAAIGGFFPGTDWSDPAWGIYECEHGSIEFNIGKEATNSGFALHVRASDAIIGQIVAMLRQCGWQGIDVTTGQFLERAAAPATGLQQWTRYRDQVIDEE